MDGEELYYAGRVLWVVKTGNAVYGRVLGEYPYTVEIGLKDNSTRCTCPKGGSCEHVEAVKFAFERGFYFECPEGGEVFPEACALSMLESVPQLALEVVIKELRHALETDESGSLSAELFFKSFKLLKKVRNRRKLAAVEALLDEYSSVFPDYQLTERLKSEFQRLKVEM